MNPEVLPPIKVSPAAASIVLLSDRLRVEIAFPGTVYHGPRFDWTGLVSQVTLDGRHTFCGQEGSHATSTGGIGLCNEFGIFHPIGYDDAAVGDQFPKLGVGLLTKLDASDYGFHIRYPVQPFPVRVAHDETAAVFTVDPLECRGYAAKLIKRVSVRGPELTIYYDLENTGSRPLATREYNHNFLSFDTHPIGSAYALHLPCKLEIESNHLSQDAAGTVHWLRRPKEPFYVRTDADLPPVTTWTLEHRPTGLWASEETSHPWRVFALYGTPRVISPEAFLTIKLQPGERIEWTRRYVFGCGDCRP
jgi:hypothetical protein